MILFLSLNLLSNTFISDDTNHQYFNVVHVTFTLTLQFRVKNIKYIPPTISRHTPDRAVCNTDLPSEVVPTNGSHHPHNPHNHHSEDLPVPPPPAKKEEPPATITPKKETPVKKEVPLNKNQPSALPDLIPGFGDRVKETDSSPNIDAILR